MTQASAELEAQKDTLELLNNETAARPLRQSDSLAKIDTRRYSWSGSRPRPPPVGLRHHGLLNLNS
jgi:hypothetical protein